jgi:hypothetical protein
MDSSDSTGLEDEVFVFQCGLAQDVTIALPVVELKKNLVLSGSLAT